MNWHFAYTPYIWPSVFTVLLLIALAVYSGRRRSVPGALLFMIGCLFTSLWMAGSIMEIAALDVATKVFWIKVQGPFMLPAITAVTCFILEYTWPGRWLTHRNLALLVIVPLMVVGLVLTNDLHHLVWLGFVYDGSVTRLFGPATWVFVIYAMLLGLIDILVFAWLFLRSPQHRWPVVVMLTGLVGARAVYLLEAVNIIHSDLPLVVIVVGFLFLMYAVTLFGFRIFNPIPLARQTVIEQLHEGMLVLDSQGRLVSLNPAAERILGMPAKEMKGKLVRDLLPDYPEEPLTDPGETTIEFSLGTGSNVFGQNIAGQNVIGQNVRHYTLRISLLNDWRGLEAGHLLMLRDVTEQKQAQAQILEQHRSLAMLQEREQLARELHDNLGQVFAFVNTQGQTIQRLLARADVSKADEYAARLVEVAREADVDIRESIMGLRVTLSEQGFFPALAEYLERYEKNYEIHTELDRPETLGELAFEPQVEVQLLRILQEALTNARKHADARYVRILFTVQDGCAQVTVQDDGRGFDSQERLSGLDERVGLRVMRERVDEVGGSFTIQSKPGEGTRVVVRVPVRGDSL